MRYVASSTKEGNELKTLKITLKLIDLPAEETDPCLEALSSDKALRAVYHWYWTNIPEPDDLAARKTSPLKPVVMPTMFIWPPGAGNVPRETAEANALYVKGPDRYEILEGARNFAHQKEPEKVTRLLLEHLAEHAH